MDIFDTVTASQKGHWVHLTNAMTAQPAYLTGADGEEDRSRPCRIHLLGMDAPEYKRQQRARAATIAKKRGGNMDIGKMSVKQIEALLADGDEVQIDDAVDATIGWENLPIKDDGRAQYSPENARHLYERYPSILRQVTQAQKDEASLFQTA